MASLVVLLVQALAGAVLLSSTATMIVATVNDARWLNPVVPEMFVVWAIIALATGAWLAATLAHLGLCAWAIWAALLVLAVYLDPLIGPAQAAYGTLIGDPLPYRNQPAGQWVAPLLPVGLTLVATGAGYPIGRALRSWWLAGAPRRFSRRRTRMRARLGVQTP